MMRDFQIDDVTPSAVLSAYNSISVRVNTGVARFLEAAGYYPEPLVYGGYASSSRARILGRVVMSLTHEQRRWLKDRRGWRQFFDAQVPGELVVVRFGQAEVVTCTDDDGYFEVELPDHGLGAGHHHVDVQVLNRHDVREVGGVDESGRVRGRVRATSRVSRLVRVVADDERFGVVSDIDDTIVVSMIPRPMVAARHAFIDYVSAREAVPGMSEFLRFLGGQATMGGIRAKGSVGAKGGDGSLGKELVNEASAGGVALACEGGARSGLSAPQVYLSTGAWNMVPVLRDFVARGRFPLGAFLMTDFGPSNTGWFRSGKEHKRRELRRLVDFFPQMSWYLVGDDGQRDPMIYAEFARECPDNVAGIAIRSLSTVEQILTHGTPGQIVPDALRNVPPSVPVWVGEDGYALLEAVRGS